MRSSNSIQEEKTSQRRRDAGVLWEDS